MATGLIERQEKETSERRLLLAALYVLDEIAETEDVSWWHEEMSAREIIRHLLEYPETRLERAGLLACTLRLL